MDSLGPPVLSSLFFIVFRPVVEEIQRGRRGVCFWDNFSHVARLPEKDSNFTGMPTPPSPPPSPSCGSPLHRLPHHHLPSPSLSPVLTSPCHIMVTLTLTLTFPHPCFTLAQPASLCTKPKWEWRLLALLSRHITITSRHHHRSTLV